MQRMRSFLDLDLVTQTKIQNNHLRNQATLPTIIRSFHLPYNSPPKTNPRHRKSNRINCTVRVNVYDSWPLRPFIINEPSTKSFITYVFCQ